MTIYVDGLLFLNFFFDFLLLLSVSIILKRNVSIFRVIIGAFIGSLTILILFFKITSFELFLIKVYLSIIMCLVSFGYKDLKYTLKNILFLYLVSIILGGFLYMINIEFGYKQEGLIFINKGISLNIIFLIIFSPIVLYIYVKEMKSYKAKIGNYYKVNIYIGKKVLNLNGYLDTGINDTMKDLIVNFIGAATFSTLGYFYIKTKKGYRLLEGFVVKKERPKRRKKRNPTPNPTFPTSPSSLSP